MKKIVITGGAGFIGSHIVNYFYKNYKKSNIVVIDKLTYAGNLKNLGSLLRYKRIKFVKADIGTYKIMKKALSETDLLINAAAESHVDNSFGNSEIFSKKYSRTYFLIKLSLIVFAIDRSFFSNTANEEGSFSVCFL